MERTDKIEAISHTEEENLLLESQCPSWELEKVPLRAKINNHGLCSIWKLTLGVVVLTIFSLFGYLFLRTHEKPPSFEEFTCHPGMARPEWRSLPLHRRHAYTAAVQRLSTLPSKLGLNTSLYDDFTYVHIQLTYQVHHTALSLPWHRYFLHVYEKTLIEDGKYDGILPYWDWTLDSMAPSKSPIWDSFAGFGGNGTSPQGCVTEGILGSMTASYVEEGYSEHCVTRKFEDDLEYGEMHGEQYTPDIIRDIVETSHTYYEFRERLESGPHKHLHLGIGGEMQTISSTNDPLFFVHHTQVDRLWWLWQQQKPDERTLEFSGPVGSGILAEPEGVASLNDKILMLDLAEDTTVRNVMTTNRGILCYKYSMEY